MFTAKKKQFCHEYLIDNNMTNAAIRAGYSKKTAHSQGSRLLKDVDVINYVARLQSERNYNSDITVQMVVDGFAKCAFAADIENEDGKMVSAYKQADKTRALEMLAKHLGMFTENIISTARVYNINAEEMSDDELAEIARK